MAIKTVGVVGAGTMGSGIAQVAAQSGYDVKLVEVVPSQLDRGQKGIERNWDRSVEKGRITSQDKAAALARITASSDFAILAPADIVVEAITELFEAKTAVIKKLEECCSPEALFASNTSVHFHHTARLCHHSLGPFHRHATSSTRSRP